MDSVGSHGSCYYSILGIRKNASAAEIRGAYRKLAMKWHPDKWTKDPTVAGEAKRRFQQIQESYSVLSDDGKRAMYDAGFYDLFEEEDEGFVDFMQEMLSMMDNVRAELVCGNFGKCSCESRFSTIIQPFLGGILYTWIPWGGSAAPDASGVRRALRLDVHFHAWVPDWYAEGRPKQK